MPQRISRRAAITALAGAAALPIMQSTRAATDPIADPPKREPGALRHSLCRWCYRDIPLNELCAIAREVGAESIELLDPDEWKIVREHGLTCAMANGVSTIPDGFNAIENHKSLVPGFKQRIREVSDAGLPNVICFSGNRRGMDDEQGLENCAIGLRQIMSDAERAGVTVCMELLNSRVDHIDYQCDRTPWGVELVRRVGSPNFKLLYDIYHMQIMEGDVIRTIRAHHDFIAHYHTGGNPGRHEFTRASDIQELNYHSIAEAIAQTGFRGFIAQEFIPTREPKTALREAIAMCQA